MTHIDLYTSSTCPHCHTAKEYLKQNGIKFTEHNISTDPEAKKVLIAKGLRGVPAFVIGDESFAGLDIERVMRLIDYKVIECPNCHQKLRVPKDKNNIKITCQNCNESFVL